MVAPSACASRTLQHRLDESSDRVAVRPCAIAIAIRNSSLGQLSRADMGQFWRALKPARASIFDRGTPCGEPELRTRPSFHTRAPRRARSSSLHPRASTAAGRMREFRSTPSRAASTGPWSRCWDPKESGARRSVDHFRVPHAASTKKMVMVLMRILR
jgi:hypothetical protein